MVIARLICVFAHTHVPSGSPEQSWLHLEGYGHSQPPEIQVLVSIVLRKEEGESVCVPLLLQPAQCLQRPRLCTSSGNNNLWQPQTQKCLSHGNIFI